MLHTQPYSQKTREPGITLLESANIAKAKGQRPSNEFVFIPLTRRIKSVTTSAESSQLLLSHNTHGTK